MPEAAKKKAIARLLAGSRPNSAGTLASKGKREERRARPFLRNKLKLVIVRIHRSKNNRNLTCCRIPPGLAVLRCRSPAPVVVVWRCSPEVGCWNQGRKVGEREGVGFGSCSKLCSTPSLFCLFACCLFVCLPFYFNIKFK